MTTKTEQELRTLLKETILSVAESIRKSVEEFPLIFVNHDASSRLQTLIKEDVVKIILEGPNSPQVSVVHSSLGHLSIVEAILQIDGSEFMVPLEALSNLGTNIVIYADKFGEAIAESDPIKSKELASGEKQGIEFLVR